MPAGLDLPASGRAFSAAAMARPIRVLFIVSQPTVSPAISVHANLMRFLDPGRVEVHVVYNRLAGEPHDQDGAASVLSIFPRAPNVHLIPAEFGPEGGAGRAGLIRAAARTAPRAIRDSGALVRYIRRHRIDVLHCEERPRSGFYALALARLTGARCIMHFHWKYGRWMSPLSRAAVHRTDAIITVSRWTGRVLHEAGVPRQRIFPVVNGIDPAAFEPGISGADAVRQELGLTRSDPLVVMVAQLVEWKRQHLLIEAFRRVADAHPRARLLLVGADPHQSGEYAARCHRLAGELGMGDRILFAGRRQNVREILAAADIHCLPSVDDPCALVHIEAMAMKTPAVAVRAGGAPELIDDGVTGLLSAPDDVEALAANLTALISDPDRRQEMGLAGRRRVLEHLNARRMAWEVEAVYRLMCLSRKAPSAQPGS